MNAEMCNISIYILTFSLGRGVLPRPQNHLRLLLLVIISWWGSNNSDGGSAADSSNGSTCESQLTRDDVYHIQT